MYFNMILGAVPIPPFKPPQHSLYPTTPPNMDAGAVISDELAISLENTRSPNKKRKISMTALSSPASSNHINPASFSALFTNIPQENAKIEIPERLESAETYDFIGFDKDTARELWARYRAHPTDDPCDFMDYARSHVDSPEVRDVQVGVEDWRGVMSRLGIKSALQTAILHPDFEDLRATAGCMFWIIEAMNTAYATLEHLNNQLRPELPRRQKIMKTEDGEKSPLNCIALATPNQGAARNFAVLNHEPHKPEAPASLDGHTMVWYACPRFLATKCCESHPDELDIYSIKSWPGVFRGERPVVCFTPQRETANRYAAYMKHRVPIAEIALLQVAVPDSLLQSLSMNYLWSDGPQSDAWKKVIWHSRRGDQLPKDLRYMGSKDIWIGILHGPAMPSSQRWKATGPSSLQTA